MKLVRTLAVIAILFACDVANAAGIVGRRAPRIRVRRWITPNPPSTADLQGRVYVIEFWATWCPACMQSIPHMIQLADKYRDKEVLLIGLSTDKSVDDVRRVVQNKRINYHVGMDNGISKRFLFAGIPTAFVISHTGRVVWQGHPMSQKLEAAVADALKTAPPPFLADLKLGPFENLRLQLSGGRDFVKAYRQLKIEAGKANSQTAEIADKIIKAIDGRIKKRIEEAEQLRKKNPLAAFAIYQQIVKKFRGIEPVKPAVAAHDELKDDAQVKKEMAAARGVQKAQGLLAICRGCSTCGDFNPGCKNCVDLNRTILDRAKEILKAVSEKYEGTNAAKTARQRLKELNCEILQVK